MVPPRKSCLTPGKSALMRTGFGGWSAPFAPICGAGGALVGDRLANIGWNTVMDEDKRRQFWRDAFSWADLHS